MVFQSRLKNFHTVYSIAQIQVKKKIFSTFIEKRMRFVWNRIIVNETHQNVQFTTQTIQIFRRLNKFLRKWFMIKTFLEISSKQISIWIDTMTWKHLINVFFQKWKRCDIFKSRFFECFNTNIFKLSFDYEKAIKNRTKNTRFMR